MPEPSPQAREQSDTSLHSAGAVTLTPHEEEILTIQLNGLPGGETAKTVFAYATSLDVFIIAVSSIAAIIAGSLNPLLTIIYGQLVGALQGYSNGSLNNDDFKSQVATFTLYYVYLAIGVFVFIYITTVGFYYTGERITRSLRRAYLQAIIRQNIGFFDLLGAGEVTTRITSDINLIQEAITSKISLSLTAAATFTTAFIIAFVEYWKLALILTSVIVAVSLAGALGGKVAVKHNKESLAAYSSAATIAEETIASVRHVTAFGIQEQLAQKYRAYLLQAEVSGTKSRIAIAFMISFMMATPYFSYGLAFWQGSRYLVAGEMSSAGIVTTTFAILIGAFTIGRVAPNTQAFVSSIASASKILQVIARQSPQDPLSDEGVKPTEVRGDLALENVSLVYPSRTDVKVLDDVNLHFPAAKTTAIVGPSGCGKSSIVGLIERFYTPINGKVVLDGHDVQDLNLKWLRRQISFVGQESILFGTSIFENISLGLTDEARAAHSQDLHDMVINAAKKSNAHEFITSLPDGYETQVGERGLQLSGGQRQRIAIARALISDPMILLLDEATSALDSKSERAVQLALESAAKGRTTIAIAHRLSTVQNADNIVVMSKGKIVEQGKHDDLMSRGGVYASLVQRQQFDPMNEQRDAISIGESTPDARTDEKSHYLTHDDADEKAEDLSSADILSSMPSESSQHKPFGLWKTVKFITRLNSPEKLILIVALICCILAGLIIPVQSVFLAETINSLSLQNYGKLRHDIDFWSLMFLMVAIVALIVWIGHGVCLSYSTEKLTSRVREKAFRTILRQEVGYFDEKAHSSGAMTALVSSAPADLNSLNGAVIGNILTFISVLTGGVILSLVIGWKLALVCSATIPAVAACGWIRLTMLALFDTKVRQTHQESASYASESITAIRTVASLSLEEHILDHYSSILAQAAAKSLQSILKASALYAASQSFTFLFSALGYWYGSTLLESNEYSLLQFFICFAALITGSQIAGSIFSYAPDMSKAMHAASDLSALFNRQPSIDTWSDSGARTDKEKCNGRIEIQNVSFRYPTRPDRVVLDNFSLSVQPGQYIALVGSSGCGKSTLIALLERFFDPSSGQVLVDGANIAKLNVNNYRDLVSLVGQEPVIYQGTIRENVKLGSPADVTDEAVIQACKEANIYSFIETLPDGFSTVVGSRGSMLSGGQKQRIAIARALLRNPKILLLDEATSALDSESEKVVQEALDAAAKHRTTIAVAHRLSTIQRADLICVLDKGVMVESGTHSELMARKGLYFELVEMQSLKESTRALNLD